MATSHLVGDTDGASTIQSVWPDDIVGRMQGVGAFLAGYPDNQGRSGDVTVTPTGDALTTKLRALRCHRSQIGPLVERLGETRPHAPT